MSISYESRQSWLQNVPNTGKIQPHSGHVMAKDRTPIMHKLATQIM